MSNLTIFVGLAFGQLEVLLLGLFLGVSLARFSYPWLVVSCVIAGTFYSFARYSALAEIGQERGLTEAQGDQWPPILGTWIAIFLICHGVWLLFRLAMIWFKLSRYK